LFLQMFYEKTPPVFCSQKPFCFCKFSCICFFVDLMTRKGSKWNWGEMLIACEMISEADFFQLLLSS
jgi:hypothetical protein